MNKVMRVLIDLMTRDAIVNQILFVIERYLLKGHNNNHKYHSYFMY